MAHPLDGARAKLSRANEHLDVLDAEVRRILEPHANTRFIHVRPDGDGYVVYCDPLPEIRPLRLGAICGDLIHNMRSALDYVVTELLIALDKQPTSSNYFPIYSESNEWLRFVVEPKDPKRSPLYGLDPEGKPWALIKEAQPFNRGEDAWRNTLAMLKMMDNRDKHSALSVQMAFPIGSHMDDLVGWRKGVYSSERRVFTEPLSTEKSTDLMRLAFRPLGIDPEVHVKGALGINPTFGNEKTQLGIGVLRSILNTVTATVESFTRFFPAR